MSIVSVILAVSSVSSELTEVQHEKALEYLSLHLAIRDRQQIVKVLCQRNPDILTAAIRDAVDAYAPMIRLLHEAVNLSDTLWDFEQFLTDMLKVAQPAGVKGQEKLPSVEDFVDLLHRHQKSCHKFIHQFAKNGKEMAGWWRDYVRSKFSIIR
jgi:Mg2+ and Co2+ transporter CorA